MQDEILTLLDDVSSLTGFTEKTLGCYFGNAYAAKRVRDGGATLKTCIDFKKYLEAAKAYGEANGAKELKKWLLDAHKNRTSPAVATGQSKPAAAEKSTENLTRPAATPSRRGRKGGAA